MKNEYDRANVGVRSRASEYDFLGPVSLEGDDGPEVVNVGGRWIRIIKKWLRIHLNPRRFLFDLTGSDGGPPVDQIANLRVAQVFLRGGTVRFRRDNSKESILDPSLDDAWAGNHFFCGGPRRRR